MSQLDLGSELLDYMIARHFQAGDQLPSLNELSEALNINVGKVREQLEVARVLGLVEVRPRTGIRARAYDFLPAVRLSLFFALAGDKNRFEAFTELRNHLEVAFLEEAAAALTEHDKERLTCLLDKAWAKLNQRPFIEIPHAEHKQFHMGLFARLDNPFVRALLEAYWEAYEAVELNAFAELSYWQEAWSYHEKMLTHIIQQDYEAAKSAFIAHTRRLRHRLEAEHPVSAPTLKEN